MALFSGHMLSCPINWRVWHIFGEYERFFNFSLAVEILNSLIQPIDRGLISALGGLYIKA